MEEFVKGEIVVIDFPFSFGETKSKKLDLQKQFFNLVKSNC